MTATNYIVLVAYCNKQYLQYQHFVPAREGSILHTPLSSTQSGTEGYRPFSMPGLFYDLYARQAAVSHVRNGVQWVITSGWLQALPVVSIDLRCGSVALSTLFGRQLLFVAWLGCCSGYSALTALYFSATDVGKLGACLPEDPPRPSKLVDYFELG